MVPDQLLVPMILYFACKKLVIDTQCPIKLLVILLITAGYSAVIINSKSEVKQPNAYELLGLSRKLSTEEIRSQYKQALRFKHPDKNPSPNAEQEFRTIKENFDLIRTDQFRISYELTGSANSKNSYHSDLAGYYIAWVLVCNILYFTKLFKAGSTIFCVITAMGVYESFFIEKVMFLLSRYFIEMAIFEQIRLIRSLMFAVSFLVCSLESLWVKEKEEELEINSERFYGAEGGEILEIIRIKAAQEDAASFLKAARNDAIKKYSESYFKNFVLIAIFLIFAKNKLDQIDFKTDVVI